MRLSEAIALGSLTLEWNARNLEGCALGMAANAAGCARKYRAIENKWPWLKEMVGITECPIRGHILWRDDFTYMSLIAHIFDVHVMIVGDCTFEHLIDWVRSIEPAEEETNEQTRIMQCPVRSEDDALPLPVAQGTCRGA